MDPIVIDNLQTILLNNHPYIGYYCHVYELIRKKPVEEQEEITIRLHVNLQQDQSVRLANSKAGIKPTAPLSAFDKENSIEFLLDSLYYLYNYYMVYALLSHAYNVTSCDVTL